MAAYLPRRCRRLAAAATALQRQITGIRNGKRLIVYGESRHAAAQEEITRGLQPAAGFADSSIALCSYGSIRRTHKMGFGHSLVTPEPG
jgi:hypothetical protein